jgi:hypothetical protein
MGGERTVPDLRSEWDSVGEFDKDTFARWYEEEYNTEISPRPAITRYLPSDGSKLEVDRRTGAMHIIRPETAAGLVPTTAGSGSARAFERPPGSALGERRGFLV